MNMQVESLMPLTPVPGVKARTGTKRKKLTQKKLKELLHYDTETGVFTWLVNINHIKIGDIAGGHNKGHMRIAIDKKLHYSHRLAWLYVYGYFSENTIDHINRIRDDNRIANLREATVLCQSRNCKIRSHNTSSLTGVGWHKTTGMWRASIGLNNKTICLGNFTNKLEAACHRYAAEQCLGFQDCDTTSSAREFIYKKV